MFMFGHRKVFHFKIKIALLSHAFIIAVAQTYLASILSHQLLLQKPLSEFSQKAPFY